MHRRAAALLRLAEHRQALAPAHARRLRLPQFLPRQRHASQRDLQARRLSARRRDVARPFAGGAVTTLRLATPADDDVIRALLRDNAMPSWVEMTIEREPSFFSGANLLGRDWAVIAEEEGQVLGMYTAAMMPVHVDGHAERLGYLGGLRVSAPHRRRIRHLRAGYESIVPLAPLRVPFWFT